jgi:hypothetical protein
MLKMKKTLIFISFLTSCLVVNAQEMKLERVEVGDSYKNRFDVEIELKSFSFAVKGDKCYGKMGILYVASQRILNTTDEYKATKKSDGVLCSEGKYSVLRADGLIESGSVTFSYMIKKGVAYRIR